LWESFNSGLIDPNEVRDSYSRLLLKEWSRCAKVGVDPTLKIGAKCTEDVFQSHLLKNERLVGIARPVIDKITAQLADVPGIVLLADHEGVILYIAGDVKVREAAMSRSGVVEGSCWLESVAGTNGMGSALSKRESVHVFSSEHYCEGWHRWTCAATPLLDEDSGEVIGVVDFTTIDKYYRDQALALTSSMAQAISSGFEADGRAARHYLFTRYEDLCARYRAEQLVLLDERGRVVRTGRNNEEKLILPKESLEQCADAIPIRLLGTGRRLGTAYVLGKDACVKVASVSAEAGRRAGIGAGTIGRLNARRTYAKPAPAAAMEARAADTGLQLKQPLADGHASSHEKMLQDAADYQVIFDNAIVGICYSVDRTILRCNRRFEEMFGYEPGELDNKEFLEIYPSPLEFRRIGSVVNRHFRTHRVYADERLMKRKDGELFWCAVSGKRLDPGHTPRTAIWILQDISRRRHAEETLQRTQQRLELLVQEQTHELRHKNEALRTEIARRKGTEEKLRESRKKYRVLFETSPVGMLVTDVKGDVLEVNKAMARMIPKADLVSIIKGSKSAQNCIIHPDGTPMRRNDLPDARALREGRTIPEFELGVRDREGSVRWFSASSAPIPVKALGAVVAHREVTETKRLEMQDRLKRAELARASRVNTMGEMAAAMAHELGQPLSSAVNFLSGCKLRLAAGEYDKEAVYETISQALHYTEQAGDIIKHIRQFVRRHQPNTILCDLNSMIREMVKFMDVERRQVGAVIESHLSTTLPPLMLDPMEFKQLMVNLVKNALEAMSSVPEPQRILTISAKRKGRKWVEVTVADRGHGVAAKDIGSIFNAFFSTKDNGLGLGLAICRSIVESHRGKLSVAANQYGGATFTFLLPHLEH
jgi:PAS domain S-box-containing protein